MYVIIGETIPKYLILWEVSFIKLYCSTKYTLDWTRRADNTRAYVVTDMHAFMCICMHVYM